MTGEMETEINSPWECVWMWWFSQQGWKRSGVFMHQALCHKVVGMTTGETSLLPLFLTLCEAQFDLIQLHWFRAVNLGHGDSCYPVSLTVMNMVIQPDGEVDEGAQGHCHLSRPTL